MLFIIIYMALLIFYVSIHYICIFIYLESISVFSFQAYLGELL